MSPTASPWKCALSDRRYSPTRVPRASPERIDSMSLDIHVEAAAEPVARRPLAPLEDHHDEKGQNDEEAGGRGERRQEEVVVEGVDRGGGEEAGNEGRPGMARGRHSRTPGPREQCRPRARVPVAQARPASL